MDSLNRFAGLVLASLSILCACREKQKGSFTVSGTYENADRLASLEGGPISKVFLLEIPYGRDQQPIVLDSAKISGKNGSFRLGTSERSQDVYELVFGENALPIPLVNDNKEITLDVDLGKKDDFYTVSGSPATSHMKELVEVFGKKNFEVLRIATELDSLKHEGVPDSALLAAMQMENSAEQDLKTYLRQFLNTNDNVTVSAVALNFALGSEIFTPDEYRSILDEQIKRYANNDLLKDMAARFEEQMAAMAQQDKQPTWSGKNAPELALPDMNGNTVSLASFKGKYLLVDFWASWCEPCREENPNVVRAYRSFKNKNFAILGVSLDKTKDAWQQAVQADSLSWTQVSDLGEWNSQAVKTFGFQSIPFNVLIDPQGKVVAQGLRGEALENKLAEVLK